MTAIKAGYIAASLRNTIMAKVKEAAGSLSGISSISPASNPDMDSSTLFFGTSATLGVDLTLNGDADTAVEVLADKLNIADA